MMPELEDPGTCKGTTGFEVWSKRTPPQMTRKPKQTVRMATTDAWNPWYRIAEVMMVVEVKVT